MKFYKITNKEECHNNMKYETGLNIDVLEFNPSGDCKSGGIYFTNIKNIFYFLNYGVWIREVNLPEGEEIYENPGAPKKWKAHRVILGERRSIGLGVIKKLVEKGADIHADNNYALRWASEYGYLDIVKYLVEKGADIHTQDDYSLRYASENGYLDIVKYLVEKGADIHAYYDYALRYASENEYLDVVKYLESLN